MDAGTGTDRVVVAPMEGCWRIVGVGGDRSCPELAAFIHCRNCPALAAAARTFFDREPPAGYIDSWRTLLEQPETESAGDAVAALVFRLGAEWLALPTSVVVEVTEPRRPHRLPHRVGSLLTGLVNIRGQIHLCVDVAAFLGIELPPARTAAEPEGVDAAARDARLVVLERTAGRGIERWVFPVDEVAGVHRVPAAALRPVPSTLAAAGDRRTAALFAWRDDKAGLIDERRLFDGLRDAVSG
jgi:chemotaxis-related protein WspD